MSPLVDRHGRDAGALARRSERPANVRGVHRRADLRRERQAAQRSSGDQTAPATSRSAACCARRARSAVAAVSVSPSRRAEPAVLGRPMPRGAPPSSRCIARWIVITPASRSTSSHAKASAFCGRSPCSASSVKYGPSRSLARAAKEVVEFRAGQRTLGLRHPSPLRHPRILGHVGSARHRRTDEGQLAGPRAIWSERRTQLRATDDGGWGPAEAPSARPALDVVYGEHGHGCVAGDIEGRAVVE